MQENKIKKKIVMVGNGSFSETLLYYITTFTEWEIVAYADEFVSEEGATHKEKPFINLNDIVEKYPPDEYGIVLGIGYRKMNTIRKRLYLKLKEYGYCFPNFIHPTAIVHNTIMGDANIIMQNVMFEPNAKIGSNTIIWGGVSIGHNANIGSHNHFAGSSVVAGNVKMGDGCFVGNQATVRDGATVADYTLLGAGVYLAKDTSPYDVVVPARAVVLEGKKSTDFI